MVLLSIPSYSFLSAQKELDPINIQVIIPDANAPGIFIAAAP